MTTVCMDGTLWIYYSGAEESLWPHSATSVSPQCVRFAAHTVSLA